MSAEIGPSVVASAESAVSEVVASQVSVRDLKTHLSEWLGRVQAGDVVEVTSHRKPIARITAVKPAEPTSSKEDEEELCYACADSKPDTMLLACGHQGLCTSCAKHLWRIDRRCPLCRTTLKGMVFLN